MKSKKESSMLYKVNKRVVVISMSLILLTCVAKLCFMQYKTEWNFELGKVVLGILVGMLLTLFRMFLLNNSIKKTVTMTVESARRNGTFDYVVRYLITGIVFVVVVRYSTITFIATAITLILSIKLSVYTIKVNDGDYSKLVDIDKQIEEEDKLKGKEEF